MATPRQTLAAEPCRPEDPREKCCRYRSGRQDWAMVHLLSISDVASRDTQWREKVFWAISDSKD